MSTPITTSQNGAALITGLIFLVVLTLISLSAIKSTSLEERMAGNARDQDVAFQAAEAGVREAMKSLAGLSPASAFAAGCSAGLCLNDPVTPVWTALTNNNQWISSKTASYDPNNPLKFDATTNLPVQPRYIIELVPNNVPAFGSSASTGKGNTSGAQLIPFRITARGWGITGQTQATVQSTVIY